MSENVRLSDFKMTDLMSEIVINVLTMSEVSLVGLDRLLLLIATYVVHVQLCCTHGMVIK